jgi:hypothetical protein
LEAPAGKPLVTHDRMQALRSRRRVLCA